MSKWQVLRDDDDLLEVKQVGARKYIFLEVLDMKAHTGEGGHCVDLALVDLDEVDAKTIRSAMECYGCEDEAPEELYLVEMLHGYGAKAPLFSAQAGGRVVARRLGRSEASKLDIDEAMDRPVNAIGSTAAEYMRGDIFSALSRGVQEGRQDARIMSKLYGVDPDEHIEDRLPFMMGFLAGKAGQPNEANEDYSPHYTSGWERGVRVARGESSPPTWIKC
jgi:hypothetical protein